MTNVGEVAGVLPGASQSNPQPITFDFAGQGQGLLVYDASNRIATETGNMGQMVITTDSTDPTKGRLLFEHLNNAVIYGANTDIDFYGPTIAAQGFNPNTPRVSLLVDNRLPSTVRYFAGPTIPPHIVRVMAAYGPVFIQGAGALTRVEIDPANVNNLLNTNFTSPGDDLLDTILADVTVSNSYLTIRPDLATTPASSQLKNVLITDTQVTGLAGAAIHYADLRDIDNIAYITPGLLVQLPRHAAEVTIADTPAGVTTGIHVIGLPLANVHVLGTTGKLALGSLGQSFETNAYALDGFQPVNFAAQSLTIGDGSVQNIRGEVLLGRTDTFTVTAGTVIDNRSDSSPRDASFYISPVNFLPIIEGLAPAAIRMRQLSGGLSIYDSAGSHFTAHNLDSIAEAVTLYGGLGSTVDLVATGTGYGDYDFIPAMRVLGAETVRLLVPALEGQVRYLHVPTTSVVRIEADPARPNDVTHLIADFSEVYLVYIGNDYFTNFVELLDIGGDGTGRLSLGDTTFATQVEFAAATTEFTLFGSKYDYYPQEIRIADSGPRGTVIYPGRQKVNVLGTNGPVEIHQPRTPLSGSNPFAVVVGNAGNMQAIHGDVTVIGDDAALPVVPLTLNDSADGTSRTTTVSYPSANHWAIGGLAPATIHVLGALVDISLLAGTGNNTLVGPDYDNLWEINATNGGKLNSRLTYGGIANLMGGALGDEFFVKQGGLVGGNLDGGPGYDVIRFDSNVLSEGEIVDLPAGIVPRINGTVTNVEAVPIDILPVNDQTSTVGASIAPIHILAWGGIAPLTYSAVGLPANLVIDVHTGYISGTISNGADASSPYNVVVTASDGFASATVDFQWFVSMLLTR